MRFEDFDDPDPPSPPEDLFETVAAWNGSRVRALAGMAAVLALLVGSGLVASRTGDRPQLVASPETSRGPDGGERTTTTQGGDRNSQGDEVAAAVPFTAPGLDDSNLLVVAEVPVEMNRATRLRHGAGVVARAMWSSDEGKWLDVRVENRSPEAVEAMVDGLEVQYRANGRSYWSLVSGEVVRNIWVPAEGLTVTTTSSGLDLDLLTEILDGTTVENTESAAQTQRPSFGISG